MITSKTTLRLLFLTLIGLAMAWFVVQYLPADGYNKLPRSFVSDTLKVPDYFALETTNATISCSREHGMWMIHGPSKTRADGRHIEMIVNTIMSAHIRDRVTLRQRKSRELGLDAYGLVVPRAIVTLSGHGVSARLRIGADTPYEDGVFVMTDDSSDIYIADRIVSDILPQSATQLRDRALMPDSGRNIEKIEVRQPGKIPVVITKSGTDWMLASPFNVRASALAVNAFVDTLNNATIDKFVWIAHDDAARTRPLTEAAAPYGLSGEEARMNIFVWYKDESRPVELVFGNTDPENKNAMYVLSSADNIICTTDAALYDTFRMEPEFIRDRRVFTPTPSDIVSLSVQGAALSFAVARDDAGDWRITRPSEQDADPDEIRAFMETLLNLRDAGIRDIAPDAEFAPDALRLDIVPALPKQPVTAYLTYRTDVQPAVLDIAMPERRLAYTVNEAFPDAFLTPEGFSRMVSKDVLKLDSDTVTAITRTAKGGESETVIRSRHDTWVSEKPLPVTVNAGVPETLVALFANLCADRVATAFYADAAQYGLNFPATEYIITTHESRTPVIILLIGDTQSDGSAYAKIKGRNTVFVLPAAAVKTLSQNLTRTPL